MKHFQALSAILVTAIFLSCSVAPLGETRRIASDNSADSFNTYVHLYNGPQYFQSNTLAYNARLKLIDMAPPGGSIKIATFTVENGPIVRQLARHLCLAASRGVNVELLADSKSGDKAGSPNPFNLSDDVKVVEELYQYLANCGAKIYIHNHLTSYIEVMGQRLPNVFLDPAQSGQTFSFLGLLFFNSRLNAIVNKVAGVANAEFAAAGVKADSGPLLSNLKKFALELLQLSSSLQNATDVSNVPSGYSGHVSNMNSAYLAIINDPIWDAFTSESQLKTLLPKIVASFNADPELKALHREIHRFNRLNHRKLFVAESANGQAGCMILGGRNLGDHYLAGHRDAYLDGDVLLCRHHGAEQNAMEDAANGSFTQLKTDLSDPLMGQIADNSVRLLKPDPAFVYSSLFFPQGLAPRGARTMPYSGKLPAADRSLVKETHWADGLQIPGDLELKDTKNWRLLKSGWDPAHDEVQPALIKLIENEKKEIYIETAYGEFNQELRGAIEDALKRGVKIKIVTNSFFSSDGSSKIIRLLMSNWVNRLQATYPANFQILFSSYEGGHMTHFKGAGFACQPGAAGNVRTYIIGSHNFHPRSGRSDKEHALFWDQPGDATCVSGFDGLNDIMQFRTKIYAEISN
ncbi:MAG: phospholipase D-like domain-containing protein, partial [Bdellovibrionota bacterium]